MRIAKLKHHGETSQSIMAIGNESDYAYAFPLLDEQEACSVIADKGYDSDVIIEGIKQKNAECVIPPRSHRIQSRPYDDIIYKERNAIERMFCRLKQFRRIASRYDKLASSYRSFLHVASIAIWTA